jgi:DNA modification methylase
VLWAEWPLVSSPKQDADERRTTLFPYYAGFSERFVDNVLDVLNASSGQVVFDPWNGSGTTTAVAKRRGYDSVGVDLNPALAIVARAKLASHSDALTAKNSLSTTPMCVSFSALRVLCEDPYHSPSQAMLMLAVFRIVRRKLRRTYSATANPTWWRNSTEEVKYVIPTITKKALISEIDQISEGLCRTLTDDTNTKLVIGDMLTTDMPTASVDIVITSPPYLTRIDYVKATLPELSILWHLYKLPLDEMRQKMIGSPIVGRGPNIMPIDLGDYTKSILVKVAEHNSKASRTYYLSFFSTYIAKMYLAFLSLQKVVRPGGKLVMVVQGSHYKEIYLDLSRICTELASSTGFDYVSRADFQFKQSFAQLNPKAYGYSKDTALESALILERQS